MGLPQHADLSIQPLSEAAVKQKNATRRLARLSAADYTEIYFAVDMYGSYAQRDAQCIARAVRKKLAAVENGVFGAPGNERIDNWVRQLKAIVGAIGENGEYLPRIIQTGFRQDTQITKHFFDSKTKEVNGKD